MGSFMSRNQDRSHAHVKEAFYEGPLTQDSHRLFYLIAARLSTTELDSLAYQCFKVGFAFLAIFQEHCIVLSSRPSMA